MPSVKIKQYFEATTIRAGTAYTKCIEYIEFANGTIWGVTDVNKRALQVQNGTSAADNLWGLSGTANSINGFAGNDTLRGDYGYDKLDGGEGDDSLYGYVGNDTLIGGTGNDYLAGCDGSDTYIFNQGDGADTISDFDCSSSNIDTLKLGDGLLASTAVVTFNRGDLTLTWGTDSVTLSSYVSSTNNRIENIEFADGTKWTAPDLYARSKIFNGSSVGDDLYGWMEFTNTINGLAGDDDIFGGSKNDTLIGGPGNDYLYGGNSSYFNGGNGSDTYIFNQGDGADTICDCDWSSSNIDTLKFGDGLLASTAVVTFNRGDLTLTWGTDSVTLSSYLSSINSRIENIEFADGTKWTAPYLAARLQIQNGTPASEILSGWGDFTNTLNGLAGNDTLTGGSLNDVLDGGTGNDSLYGGTGNDTLYGEAGDDTMIGGTGNDTLMGRWGNDTYVFNQGDGADTVSDQDWTAGNNDTLELGIGLLASNTSVVRTGNDLTMSWGSDSVYMPSFFYSSAYQIELFKFKNGTTWGLADIAKRLNGTDQADRIAGMSDLANTINGLAGNDTLTGGNKDDVLIGGDGNDALNGGMGNDTLSGGNGKDTLTGGTGSDQFVFSNSPIMGNSDVLTDFMASQGDQILFDISFFTQLRGKSDLTNHMRKYSDASVGGDDYIVYDNVTGNLYYDPTGLSNANAVLIANLQNKPLTMAANQFAVL